MPLPARPRAHGGRAVPGGDAHVPTIVSECKTFQAAEAHPLMETQASQSALRLPPRRRPMLGCRSTTSTCKRSCAIRSLHCRTCPHSYGPPCGARWCRRSSACGRNAARAQPPAQAVREPGNSSYWRRGCCWRARRYEARRAEQSSWDERPHSSAASGSNCCNPRAGCTTRHGTLPPYLPTRFANASDARHALKFRGAKFRERARC